MFEFWAFLFFNLVFDPLKMAAVCYFLVQKLPMDVLSVCQRDELSLMSSLEFWWGDVREPTLDIEKKVLSTDQLGKIFVTEVLFSSVPS